MLPKRSQKLLLVAYLKASHFFSPRCGWARVCGRFLQKRSG